jgi:hypothetical protein
MCVCIEAVKASYAVRLVEEHCDFSRLIPAAAVGGAGVITHRC